MCAIFGATAIGACDEPTFALLGPQSGQVYRAALAGSSVRPSGSGSSASGTFAAQLRDTTALRDTLKNVVVVDSATSIQMQVSVTGIDSVTAVHIHAGTETTAAGPLMLSLFTSASGTATGINGVLNQRTVTRSSALTAPYNRDSLLVRLRNGTAYVDVHTRRFPGGELRGQITESPDPYPF